MEAGLTEEVELQVPRRRHHDRLYYPTPHWLGRGRSAGP
jgi:hypothetical protein